jgi:small subunit ribosomal protein S4
MGKYVGSVCRLCRREGEKLFLKGTRCYTHRCAMERRAYPPGQHGSSRKTKLSNFGLQMREKQKMKRIYGLLERQFRNYFGKASHRKGVTGHLLLQFLERRIDNVIYQAGFATSRRQARQIVNHGYVHINEERVNIPSFLIKENDEVILRFKDKGQKFVQGNIETSKTRAIPGWLEVDANHFKIKVKRLPERDDVGFPMKEQLVVELYSR